MADGQQFAVTLERPTNDVAVVILAGEVDLYTAPRFREVLLQTIDEGAVRVVIDLTDVSFIDSTALGVLVSGGKRLQQSDGRAGYRLPRRQDPPHPRDHRPRHRLRRVPHARRGRRGAAGLRPRPAL